MVHGLNTKIVLFSRIQVSHPLLRRKNVAAQHRATHAIRKYGQRRPLIIDPSYQLLADTASFLALKALDYDFVKVFTLTNPSPAAIRAVGRVLDCCAAISREAADFNSALASLSGTCSELATYSLILELLPVVIADTGEMSIRVLPALVPDAGCTPTEV